MRPALAAALLAAILAAPALGHEAAPGPLWRPDPLVAGLLALAGLLYAVGAARLRTRSGRGGRWRRAAVFAAGWAVLAMALVTPLDGWGARSFLAHMAEHELVMVVAAPLLVLARPGAALLWGLPGAWRRGLAASGWLRPLAGLGHGPSRPLVAWLLHAAALWLWHLPGPFEAALGSRLVHAAQHASFLLAALLFWRSVLPAAGRPGHGAAVLSLFTTAVHSSLLGALLTFETQPWYAAYAASAPVLGLSALEDQQLAGLVMWVPAGLVYAAAALAVVAAWLQRPGPALTAP